MYHIFNTQQEPHYTLANKSMPISVFVNSVIYSFQSVSNFSPKNYKSFLNLNSNLSYKYGAQNLAVLVGLCKKTPTPPHPPPPPVTNGGEGRYGVFKILNNGGWGRVEKKFNINNSMYEWMKSVHLMHSIDVLENCFL